MLVDAAVDAVAAQALGELPDAVHVLLAVVAVTDEEAQRHARRMITQVGRRANGEAGGPRCRLISICCTAEERASGAVVAIRGENRGSRWPRASRRERVKDMPGSGRGVSREKLVT